MCKHWGYERLHEHFSHIVTEEVSHSSGLIDHILYLDGMPDVEHLDQMSRGWPVADLLTAGLGFEYEDVELFRKVIAHCAKVGDFTTCHMLEDMIVDSEEHVE